MNTTGTTYQFALVKGAERYVVRCGAGDEEATIAQLMEWAENPDLDFDWFDAAVLSRQITQKIFSRVGGEPDSPDSED
jgi:hypothetical protein